MGEWERFQKRPHIVRAKQMSRPFKVKTPEGMMDGETGDWLVEGIAHELYIVKKALFEESFDWIDHAEDNPSIRVRIEEGYDVYS